MSYTRNKPEVFVSVDAEWDDYHALKLACQFASACGKSTIYLNEEILELLTSEQRVSLTAIAQQWAVKNNCAVLWVEFKKDTNLLKMFLDRYELSRRVELRMFFSPTDLTIGLGENNIKPYFRGFSKQIEGSNRHEGLEQKRCITAYGLSVDELELTIHDLKGWQPVGGLNKLAASVGVDMSSKKLLDEYKDHMLDALIEQPEVFLDYSLDDVVALHKIRDRFYEFVNKEVITDILGLEPFDILPSTTGSLVAKTFDKFLPTQFPDPLAFKLATKKLGKLPYKTRCEGQKVHERVFESVHSSTDIDPNNTDIQRIAASKKYTATGISAGAVQVLGLQQDSRAFNALVQGGRCNNERPEEYLVNHGLDIDLGSCYGSALVEFTYPIGLPTQVGFVGTQKRISLREFFKQFPLYDPVTGKGDLLPGLWTVTVSGNLSYQQDMLFSKVVEQKEINKACTVEKSSKKDSVGDSDRDSDLSHIPGVFMLTRKELNNAIITADVWDRLVKVATNSELNELYNLEVVSAILYSAQDRVERDKWADVVLASKGAFKTAKRGAGGTEDTRSTAWCEVPIGNFLNKLLAARKQVKNIKKASVPGTVEYQEADAKDSCLKLFINTLYGVFCSIYFPVGNAVVANNITARARVGTWMMNKALWTRQSITDGGIYSPLEVPYLVNDPKNKDHKNPGLHILSDWKRWKNSRNRKAGTLGSFKTWEWLIERKQACKDSARALDDLALEHINNFWANYGFSLPFSIEHKIENSFVCAAYLMKSHYALFRNDGSVYFKIRGAKDYEFSNYSPSLDNSPMYALLENIILGSDDFPAHLGYDHKYLLKIDKYREIQESSGYINLKNFLPGDAVVERRTFHFNNTYIPADTYKEYKTRADRTTKKTESKVKKNIELFERYREDGKGIEFVVKQAIADDLRANYKNDLIAV